MKPISLLVVIASTVMLGSLASCGGGGDAEAGSVTAFSVVPSTLTLTAPVGTPSGKCTGGSAGEVFIYGGAAPYRLDNTSPDLILLTDARNAVTSQVADRGGSFRVTFISNACASPVLVVVVDKLDHQVTLTLNSKPAAAAAN